MKTFQVDEQTTLRLLKQSDAPAIFRLIDSQRSYLGAWLPFVADTRTPDDSEVAVSYMLKDPDSPVFSIIKNEQLVGLIGFKETDTYNGRTEIGYWISENEQGKGIVTRSVAILCRYAFKELAIHRIQIKCAVENTQSNNIPQRLGFQLEGTERDGELQSNGYYADIHVYSLLRTDKWLS